MRLKTHEGAFPVRLVVVMMAFLSGLFLVNASLSEAASTKKKSPEVTKSAVEFTESRITQLGAALNITDDQAVHWNNVTQMMRENAKSMDALRKVRSEESKTMNTIERMKFHSLVTETNLEQQKKFIPVFEALYASMSDAQKAATDEIFKTGKHGKHKFK